MSTSAEDAAKDSDGSDARENASKQRHRTAAMSCIVFASCLLFAVLLKLGIPAPVAAIPGLAALAGSVDAIFGGWSGLLGSGFLGCLGERFSGQHQGVTNGEKAKEE
eukprot:TRINITY_DN62461_c0_g1_i1.p1 TRINITY_DN62461_c0_g1~~TRINITY_DN62461_c0_g1_i1.p1  ORF type:complete len:107 (+),score=30.82 TRINITY_DN62461_c0_g1_i1:34-354(+)